MKKCVNISWDIFDDLARNIINSSERKEDIFLSPSTLVKMKKQLEIDNLSKDLLIEFLTIEKCDDTYNQPFQALEEGFDGSLVFKPNQIIVDFFHSRYENIQNLPDLYNFADKEQLLCLLGVNCLEFFSYDFVRKYTKKNLFKLMSEFRAMEIDDISISSNHPKQDIIHRDGRVYWRENKIVVDLLKNRKWEDGKYSAQDRQQIHMLLGEEYLSF